jgi:hypothetical protein
MIESKPQPPSTLPAEEPKGMVLKTISHDTTTTRDISSRFKHPLASNNGLTAEPDQKNLMVLRYLEPGNQEFFSAVNRNFFHYKSRELKQVMRALVSLQYHPNSLTHLASLEQSVQRWEEQHPKEVEKRGRALSILKAEMIILRQRLTDEQADALLDTEEKQEKEEALLDYLENPSTE